MNEIETALPAIIIFAVLVGLIIMNKSQKKKSLLVCLKCGTQSQGKRHMRGSIFIEIVLWFCLIIPGLIYSIWRHTTSTKICTACKSNELVPINSPAAQRMLEL